MRVCGAGPGATATPPASLCTMELGAASALVGLPRAAQRSRIPELAAFDAPQAQPPPLPPPPQAQPPLPLPASDKAAYAPRAEKCHPGVAAARNTLDEVASVVQREKQLLRDARASWLASPTRLVVGDAKRVCETVANTCDWLTVLLKAAQSSFTAVVVSMGATSEANAALALFPEFSARLAQVTGLLGTATTLSADVDNALLENMPPRREASVLDFDFAHSVLDSLVSTLADLEKAAHQRQEQPKAKKPRSVGSFEKATSRLQDVIDEAITGARRMLFLRRVAATATGPTYWRGREPKDEELLEGILPLGNADANATFTTVVDMALTAHTAKYRPGTKAAETRTVALMWTDPFVIILRQLAHLDAVHGQAISVTALSRCIDAFIALQEAPEFTPDQVLLALGLQPDHLVWIKDHTPHLLKQAEQLSVLPLPELCEGFMADVVEPGMSATQMAAAQAEARQRHADRVAQLQRHVEQTSDVAAKRTLLLDLLRLKSLRRPSLRVRRGLQAFAEHAQIHAGGGSFKELRLTLFIATHMEGVMFGPYDDDKQTHACHFLFDCSLYELGVRAIFFNRHLSPDAHAHYKTNAPGRAKIVHDFLAHVEKAELDAAAAGSEYTLDAETVLKFAQRLFKDAWGSGRGADVPPWVPAAVRGR